jgi:hypothetical protein
MASFRVYEYLLRCVSQKKPAKTKTMEMGVNYNNGTFLCK